MFKNYYLAYGSNLNLNQMSYRCPSAKLLGSVILKDYRLVYKGHADYYAYLTIEKYKGSMVPLGIFEVSNLDILALDSYEGYPALYSKSYIPVKIGEQTKEALIYIMNKNFDYHLPRVEYIETCLEGYRHFGFDHVILDEALKDCMNHLEKVKRIKKP